MPTTSRPAEVLWTARYDYQPHSKLKRHRHEYFQLIHCISGEGSFQLGTAKLPLTPGVLFLIKPRKFHGLTATTQVKTLDLKFEVRDANLRQALVESNEVIHPPAGAVAHLFDQIRHEGEVKALLHRQVCDALLVQILAHVIRLATPAPIATNPEPDNQLPQNDRAGQLIQFIRGHFAEKLTLQDIAQAVGRSDRLVRELTQRAAGVPPMRYLMQYRIEKAKEFILYSDYSLKEITELSGFRTVHHFTRVFHQVTHETPGAWRRKNRQGICKDVCIDPNFSNVILTVPPSK